jgi:hypothetical protein
MNEAMAKSIYIGWEISCPKKSGALSPQWGPSQVCLTHSELAVLLQAEVNKFVSQGDAWQDGKIGAPPPTFAPLEKSSLNNTHTDR